LIEQYEKEREEMLQKIEEIKLMYKRQHTSEWELRRREEIQALKQALSDAQMYIFEEREHAMKLQHDNDALRSKLFIIKIIYVKCCNSSGIRRPEED
jgi:coiled-coil domain-containing protein 77